LQAIQCAIRARIPARRIGQILVLGLAAGGLGIAGEAAFRAKLASPEARMPSAVYSRAVPWGGDGRRAEPVPVGPIDDRLAEQRIPLRVEELPDHLIQAVLAVEDQRFYQHDGLDFRRIGGALLANLRARRVAQGGSTLTQQLAKNLFLSADRTPLRKIRETAYASVLEAQYDKAEILEAYLNEVYLGQGGGNQIHGVGAAARYYFGKDARKIGPAESAILAGMISAPNRYSPSRHPWTARRRRNLVLQLMTEQGRITRAVAERASRIRVPTRTYPARSLDSRHFRDFAVAELGTRTPARGVAVLSTLDATLQRAAGRAVREGLARFQARGIEAALVAIDPRTGDILAMIGGREYGASQFNRATEARRQPGSAFKPVVALAALERHGDDDPAFTLASVVEDEPLSLKTPAGRWEPSNYDHEFRGQVTVRQAMEQSLNVPFVRIGLAVGSQRIVNAARRLGIVSALDPVPSLALGSSAVTLLELVRAYGVFATGGDLAVSRAVLARQPLGGAGADVREPEVTRVVDPAAAYLVTSALEGVVARGTGRGLDVGGRFGAIAGKTGTSNDWRDAWFVAYSSTLVVGVWVGFDDGRSLGMTGAAAALPIVAGFLAQANPEDESGSFPVPDGLATANVARGAADWDGECGTKEVFLAGTEPEDEPCDEEAPEWRIDRDWQGRLEARAERLLLRLLTGRHDPTGR
jgi:penicillin-binding protein 1B